MYLPPKQPGAAAPTADTRRAAINRNVWALGICSLLTDASSEMVAAVLPLYSLYFLHASPAAFGVIDGLQQGGASLVRLISGWLTDRSGRHKWIAASGYIASSVSKLGLLVLTRNALALTILVGLDRIGKGIRTAPRDAIISLSTPQAQLGRAFGVHRAMDTTGAMLGPLIAFGLLRWIRDGFDVVFVVSLALGLIGAAALVTFVDSDRITRQATASGESDVEAEAWNGKWSRGFLAIAASATVLGAASISDAFIYLSLQQKLAFDASYMTLLFFMTPMAYLLLAVPLGRLADRIGRFWVILGGYAALLAIYLLLFFGTAGMATVVICVVLLGAFYAATDGVFAAAAAAQLRGGQRARGLALVATGNDVGRMASSLLFGWLWSGGAAHTAVMMFIPVLAAAMILSGVLLRPVLQLPKAS